MMELPNMKLHKRKYSWLGTIIGALTILIIAILLLALISGKLSIGARRIPVLENHTNKTLIEVVSANKLMQASFLIISS